MEEGERRKGRGWRSERGRLSPRARHDPFERHVGPNQRARGPEEGSP